MAESYSPRMGARLWDDDGDTFTRDELHQTHVNEDKHGGKSIEALRTELAASTGENVVVRRFSRFQVGEE